MRANPEVISGGSNRDFRVGDDTARTDRAGYRFESRQRRSAFLRMLFRDKTNRFAPATWELGSYPSGEDDYPVSALSWYEQRRTRSSRARNCLRFITGIAPPTWVAFQTSCSLVTSPEKGPLRWEVIQG